LRSVVASFDYLETGSEFEALLLEAELVRGHKPQFNERLRNFREFAFIKAEVGPYGRLLTSTRLQEDGSHYYGPYRSMTAARAAVAALQDALGLRGCDDPNDGEPRVPPAQHEALLDDAIAFLQGAADEVLLTLARRRDEAIARLKVDVAAREYKRLNRLRALRARHATLEFATGLNVLVLAPSADPGFEMGFLFCGGRLASQQKLPRRLPQRDEARDKLADMLLQKYHPEQTPRSFARQEEIDQLFILASWYRELREGLCYIGLPDVRPSADETRRWAVAILDGEKIA
jgi:excinuclease UvrABC nuclease subunit